MLPTYHALNDGSRRTPFTSELSREQARRYPPRRCARRRGKLVEERRHRHRSEEHTSELQSQSNLVCRLLLEKKKKIITKALITICAKSTPFRPSLTSLFLSIPMANMQFWHIALWLRVFMILSVQHDTTYSCY